MKCSSVEGVEGFGNVGYVMLTQQLPCYAILLTGVFSTEQ